MPPGTFPMRAVEWRSLVKHRKHAPIIMWVALLALLALLGVALSGGRTRAQVRDGFTGAKLDLQTTQDDNLQAAQGDKTSPDLKQLAREARKRNKPTRVIVELNETAAAPDAKWNAYGARLTRKLEHLNTRVLELPAAAAAALAARSDVRYVSLDRENIAFGHVSLTSGADTTRLINGINVTGLDGTGIGIAVLDSGMDLGHIAFTDRALRSRI